MKERWRRTADIAGTIGVLWFVSQWAFTNELKKEVRQMQNNRCAYCGQGTKRLQIHHIVPQSRGGSDKMENAIGLCNECHEHFDDLALNEGVFYDDI